MTNQTGADWALEQKNKADAAVQAGHEARLLERKKLLDAADKAATPPVVEQAEVNSKVDVSAPVVNTEVDTKPAETLGEKVEAEVKKVEGELEQLADDIGDWY